jgi:hypothetical protein
MKYQKVEWGTWKDFQKAHICENLCIASNKLFLKRGPFDDAKFALRVTSFISAHLIRKRGKIR